MDYLRKNINNIMRNFENARVYTYHKEDIDSIVNNIPEFAFIIKQIKSILKDKRLTNETITKRLLDVKDNFGNKVLDNSLIQKLVDERQDLLKLLEEMTSDRNKEFIDNEMVGGYLEDKPVTIYDLLFFPGTMIEKLPFGEELLDLLSLFFENLDVVVEFITPFVEEGMEIGLNIIMELIDFLLDFGEIIPGVGSVLAIVSMGTNIAQPFIEFIGELLIKIIIQLMDNYPNILNFMLHLSRKNYNAAVREFTELLPITEKLYSYLQDNLPIINKYISKNNSRLRDILDKAENYQHYIKKMIEKVYAFRENIIKDSNEV